MSDYVFNFLSVVNFVLFILIKAGYIYLSSKIYLSVNIRSTCHSAGPIKIKRILMNE